jgi:hypothetical protein
MQVIKNQSVMKNSSKNRASNCEFHAFTPSELYDIECVELSAYEAQRIRLSAKKKEAEKALLRNCVFGVLSVLFMALFFFAFGQLVRPNMTEPFAGLYYFLTLISPLFAGLSLTKTDI